MDKSCTVMKQIQELDQLLEIKLETSFDENKLTNVIPEEKAGRICRVVMSGCGGAYPAAVSMAEAFRRISGIKAVHHPDPMEFTRYYSDFDLSKGFAYDETLVVALGSSEEEQLIREILEKGKEKGCHTLLIRGESDICSYFSAMIALLGLAAYLGKANGHFTAAEEMKLIGDIESYVHVAVKEIETIDEQMFIEAKRLKDFLKFDLVADWSDSGSAQFVEQKLIEYSGVQATHTNSEEWVHISMMNKDPQTIGTMFMITDSSNSYGRIVDTSWGSVKLGRPTIVVSDGKREDFENELTFIALPKAPETYLAPLVNYIPGVLLASHLPVAEDRQKEAVKEQRSSCFEKAYNKFYYQGTFRTQCLDIDALTMIQFDRSVESVKSFICDPVFLKTKKIIPEGCGDSNLVGPAVKKAFDRYLPDIDFEPMEALDLSRYYDYNGQGEETVVIAVSVSGRIFRTNECLTRANHHGMTTIAMTDGKDSECARRAKYLYHTNTPAGDNNAGLRSYFANCLSLIIFAAALAEVRDGKEYLPELRRQMQAYHDAFYSEIEAIDDRMFAVALDYRKQDRNLFEMIADGPLQATARFVAAKFAEVPGDIISVTDSENYRQVNRRQAPAEAYGEMVIIDSRDPNVAHIVESVNAMVREDERKVLLFADKKPEELGITEQVDFCQLPAAAEGFPFLTPLYAYIPASILACYRATTIGEVMFRGGFYLEIFEHSYYSKEVIIDD